MVYQNSKGLSGRSFEREVASLFQRAGYNARLTDATGDKGVDIVLGDGTLVQCKAHKSPISPAVARELYGTLKHFKARRAILISLSGFTKGVFEFIRGKHIRLWDVNSLISVQKNLEETTKDVP
jgi:restriction system protein